MIKRLIKAILKVVLFVILLLVMNFILDLVIYFFPCMKIILLIIAIVGLVALYYFESK